MAPHTPPPPFPTEVRANVQLIALLHSELYAWKLRAALNKIYDNNDEDDEEEESLTIIAKMTKNSIIIQN
jgi:hypothetical protein